MSIQKVCVRTKALRAVGACYRISAIERTTHTEPGEKQQIFNAMWRTRESKGNLKGRQKETEKEQQDETEDGREQ